MRSILKFNHIMRVVHKFNQLCFYSELKKKKEEKKERCAKMPLKECGINNSGFLVQSEIFTHNIVILIFMSQGFG